MRLLKRLKKKTTDKKALASASAFLVRSEEFRLFIIVNEENIYYNILWIYINQQGVWFWLLLIQAFNI